MPYPSPQSRPNAASNNAMSETVRLLKIRAVGGGMELTLTGMEKPLFISETTVHRGSLQEGVALTPSQVEMLIQEDDFFRCDRRAARLLAARDYAIGELAAKLRQKRHTKDSIRAVTRKYVEMGALDDARYAQAAAASLIKRRPCGAAYLTAYLQKRKIDRDLAEQTAAMALEGVNTLELARTALEKRWFRFEQLELETARQKAYNYLARRGFSYDSAKTAFEQMWRHKKR